MQSISNSHRTALSAARRTRGHLVLLLAVSLLGNPLSRVAQANPLAGPAGTISIQGSVLVNGRPATDGQTLFTKSTIETAKNSESVIALANRAQLHLSATGELSITSSEKNLIGALPNGRVFVMVPAGVSLNFSTADLSITKQSISESVLFALRATECEGTRLEVISGQVEARNNERGQVVKFGESLSTGPAQNGQPQTQNSWNKKKTLGIIFGVGGAVAILLAVALGHNDQNQQIPGGCVIVPSGGGPQGCP